MHSFASPIITLAPTLWVFALGSAYFGITASFMTTPSLPELASIVDRLGGASYAQVYAVFNLAYSAGMVMPILVGHLKMVTNFFWAMLAVSLVIFVYSLLFYFGIYLLRRPRGIGWQIARPLH